MGEKAPLDARKTSLLAGGAPYLHTRAASWEKKGAFGARRASSLAEGTSYLLKKGSHVRKGHLFMPQGRLCWRKGRRFNLEGVIIGEKALFRDRRASLLEGGAPYLLRTSPSWAKMAPFRIRRATLLVGRHPYNSFGVKIRQDRDTRRMEAKIVIGSCHWNWKLKIVCAFSAGARIFISRRYFHLPVPEAPLRLRHRGCQPL